jgi:hypothetical protein
MLQTALNSSTTVRVRTMTRDRAPACAQLNGHRHAARSAWALLLARIYDVFPRVCPSCSGAMRILASITDAPTCATFSLTLASRRRQPFARPDQRDQLICAPPHRLIEFLALS